MPPGKDMDGAVAKASILHRSTWFQAYSAEVMGAWRAMGQRRKKNPVMTLWFFILLTIFIGVVLMAFNYAGQTRQDFLAVDASSILLLVFFLFLAKSLANTSRRMVRHPPLVFYLSQPHPVSDYVVAFLCSELFFNLGLLALVSGIAYAEMLVLGIPLYVPPLHFIQVTLAIIASTILGFVFAIFNSYRPIKKRIPLLFLVSGGTAVFYTIVDNYAEANISILYISIVLAIGCLSLYPAMKIFLQSWNYATAAAMGSRKNVYERTTGRYAKRLMR
ncbi:MAG: hypothetical protein QCI38_07250, partial [Candidatus Thermoplasmatota archaeon]|nr:hypothetical protein [Candidatus Thermoplasmatota archaeon]